jgi:hypothetical protein
VHGTGWVDQRFTVFTWGNGRTSTFSWSRTTNDANGVITMTETGSITSGEFAGQPAIEQVVTPDLG